MITAHHITAGSGKLPDWLIREAEETLENNIMGPPHEIFIFLF